MAQGCLAVVGTWDLTRPRYPARRPKALSPAATQAGRSPAASILLDILKVFLLLLSLFGSKTRRRSCAGSDDHPRHPQIEG
jgi:hypothetical protein